MPVIFETILLLSLSSTKFEETTECLLYWCQMWYCSIGKPSVPKISPHLKKLQTAHVGRPAQRKGLFFSEWILTLVTRRKLCSTLCSRLICEWSREHFVRKKKAWVMCIVICLHMWVTLIWLTHNIVSLKKKPKMLFLNNTDNCHMVALTVVCDSFRVVKGQSQLKVTFYKQKETDGCRGALKQR